jgi:hypothetical protein
MMADGIIFNAVEGIEDENGLIYIHDGQHRGEAAKKAGMPLRVNLQPGTRTEAEWLALTANQKHGLRRTTKDKQRVVRQALLHPYGVNLSNREIARHCGVNDKTVGRIRRELEATAEIPQLDKRIVKKASGETYEIDTSNIGGTTPAYAPIWKLETAIRQWLGETFEDLAEQLQVLAELKDNSPEGQRHLNELLWDDSLPSPNRKQDVIQACHNVLDQLRPGTQSPRPGYATLESRAGGWTNIISEPKLNGNINFPTPAEPHGEYKPQAQEFECPRCRQEKIVGVNGSRRWCLNCGAEWPTAAEFLAEVEAIGHQNIQAPSREELRERFLDILAGLEEQDVQLSQIDVWLNELENRLVMPCSNNPADEADSHVTEANSMSIMEYA